MEQIIDLDKQLFVFLNGLGSAQFDPFWELITKQLNWAPLILAVLYLIQKKLGWKNLGVVVLFLALLITFTDQTTNFFKNHFQRLRPCNDPEIMDIIRIVIHRNSFSFFSGHAANSMAATMFVVLVLRRYYKYVGLLFLFPLIFAYSRIYLGLHFPGDILTGYFFGMIFGFCFYKFYQLVVKKYPQLQA